MILEMQVQGCALSPAAQRTLERRVERLRRRLHGMAPDVVSLELVLTRQPRRREFTARGRLSLMNRVLPARRNVAPRQTALVNLVFDDFEKKLERFQATLRRERDRGRRGPHFPDEMRKALVAGALP